MLDNLIYYKFYKFNKNDKFNFFQILINFLIKK